MGRASRRKKAQPEQMRRDNNSISRIVGRLGVPDSRLSYADFCKRAAAILGRDDVEKWMALERVLDERWQNFEYSTFERAIVYRVGWRSWGLEVECAWMLPRLREALERHSSESQFLVEIGAGAGAGAAVLSAALGVPVIAVDPDPRTAGMPERAAELTGGEVTSHVAGADDLAAVLTGRRPAAVFGMGVFRHIQPHHHRDGIFSFSNSIARYIEQETAARQTVKFFQTIAPSDLLLSEQACPDYVGEISAAAYPTGYEIVAGGLTQLEVAVPGEKATVTAMHFAEGHPRPAKHSLLVENYSPLPALSPGLVVEDVSAEAIRLSVKDAQSLFMTETTWLDGSGTMRREGFRAGHVYGLYEATDRGFRRIKCVAERDWGTLISMARDNEKFMVDTGTVEVHKLAIPVSDW